MMSNQENDIAKVRDHVATLKNPLRPSQPERVHQMIGCDSGAATAQGKGAERDHAQERGTGFGHD
jgi:hypothetical protein